MPPTFAYLIGLMMYAAASVAVLCVAVVLTLFSSSRLVGIRLATGALLSLMGMLIFQIVSLPLVLLAVIATSTFFSAIDPNEGLWVMIGIPILLLPVGVFAASSAYGIYFGYRTAWLICGGTTWREAVGSDRIVSMFVRVQKPQTKNG